MTNCVFCDKPAFNRVGYSMQKGICNPCLQGLAEHIGKHLAPAQ